MKARVAAAFLGKKTGSVEAAAGLAKVDDPFGRKGCQSGEQPLEGWQV